MPFARFPCHISAFTQTEDGLCLVQFEDDWATVLWDKVDYMAGLGLTPWYVNQCSGSVSCATCSIVPSHPDPQGCQDCTACNEYEPRSTQPVHPTGVVERDLYAAVGGTSEAGNATEVCPHDYTAHIEIVS